MLNRSASLAMSTSVLKALPRKLDIKRHSPSIFYLFVQLFICTANSCSKPINSQIYRYRYCRFGNFRENFIFTNSIKRHISDVKKWQLRQELPISINNRVILPFREGFIFTKLRIFHENKVLAKMTSFS